MSESKETSNIKLYSQDIVYSKAKAGEVALVTRCWHDSEDPVQQDPANPDPILRPLKRGEVGITWLNNGEHEILRENDFTLSDRLFQLGEFCKASINDVASAVVTNVSMRIRVAHAVSGEEVPGWHTLEEFSARPADVGEYMVYNDWVGQVLETFDETLVEAAGHLIRVPELSTRLVVGDKGRHILPPPQGNLSGILSYIMGQNRPSENDTVVAVRHTVYAIAWFGISQKLDPREAEKRERPKKFWYGEDVTKLTVIRGVAERQLHVGERVFFRKFDSTRPNTRHGREQDPGGVFVCSAFKIIESETMVSLLWQDGTRDVRRAVDVIPYLNPDDLDCWPGNHVIYKGDDGAKRVAVVQTVDSKERIAKVLFLDTQTVELIPLLDIDPHGGISGELNTELGVQPGDFVFICDDNGFTDSRVPVLGEVEPWVRDAPFQEGEPVGWRKELTEVGQEVTSGHDSRLGNARIPNPADDSFNWVGEVTSLNLDGTVEVTFPNTKKGTFELKRLNKLQDGVTQLQDDLWNHGSDSGEDSDEDMEDGWEEAPGVEGEANNDWEWYDTQDRPAAAIEEDQDADKDEDADTDADADADADMDSAGSDTEDEEMSSTVVEEMITLPPEPSTKDDDAAVPAEDSSTSSAAGPSTESTWSRFEILPEAPHDHAFYDSPIDQRSKAFFSRLNREYKALQANLPDTIIVRTYEDRSDLLRSLIIGPDNTPYQDCPFVVDWVLDADFPQRPPRAHFHSWTRSNGRVNPNLYEEGKICLSILGTWQGDKSESWTPRSSSILQVLVSIQGLVLVKEPWFCEPAYEKLRGTEEGKVNSRLYSEKAYVLSRGFLLRGFELSLKDIQPAMRDFYLQRGHLKKVIADARALIESSSLTSEDDARRPDGEEPAVPRLTGGGIIALTSTLNKLQALLDTNSVKS
ncbi:hypothetical protein BD626DRAFT_505743 [Schizophyllum amplum]|uniref:UBC core domain-containing protein n=1 Tax=Schizophyllum amplum TaxID=97359 RepID=A0A550C646_9AGAR|nr:hypothetical protein BD626DRAFT_505743 [Auriculariopsis ampla]